MKTQRYILPLAAMLLVACEKVIDLPDSGFTPLLVVNAEVRADSALAVRLGRTQFLLEAGRPDAVADAVPTLTVNGTEQPAYSHDWMGTYTFAYTPRVGDSLRLRFEAEGFAPVEAATRVVAAPRVRDAQMRSLYYDEYNEDSVYSLRFTLDDPPSEANYYAVRVVCTDSSFSTYGGNTYTSAHSQTAYITCRDAMLTRPGGMSMESALDDEVERLCFSDAAIDGQQHEVNLTFTLDPPYESYGDTRYSRTIALEITSYNYDLYRYTLDVESYRSDDDELSGFVSEPQPIHTNVRGGTGIFGSSARSLVALAPRQP